MREDDYNSWVEVALNEGISRADSKKKKKKEKTKGRSFSSIFVTPKISTYAFVAYISEYVYTFDLVSKRFLINFRNTCRIEIQR